MDPAAYLGRHPTSNPPGASGEHKRGVRETMTPRRRRDSSRPRDSWGCHCCALPPTCYPWMGVGQGSPHQPLRKGQKPPRELDTGLPWEGDTCSGNFSAVNHLQNSLPPLGLSSTGPIVHVRVNDCRDPCSWGLEPRSRVKGRSGQAGQQWGGGLVWLEAHGNQRAER